MKRKEYTWYPTQAAAAVFISVLPRLLPECQLYCPNDNDGDNDNNDNDDDDEDDNDDGGSTWVTASISPSKDSSSPTTKGSSSPATSVLKKNPALF